MQAMIFTAPSIVLILPGRKSYTTEGEDERGSDFEEKIRFSKKVSGCIIKRMKVLSLYRILHYMSWCLKHCSQTH